MAGDPGAAPGHPDLESGGLAVTPIPIIKPMRGLANQPIQLPHHLHQYHLSLLPHISSLTYTARR